MPSTGNPPINTDDPSNPNPIPQPQPQPCVVEPATEETTDAPTIEETEQQ